MGAVWRFTDVEHILKKHVESKGAEYDPKKPLAALDNGAIKNASKQLGAKTWADFANVAGIPASTMQKWNRSNKATGRGTVTDEVFPALCAVAARPYRASREAYDSSEWIRVYIEESVAYALTGSTGTPEDVTADLSDQWERYNRATLLFAAFALPSEELETVANCARYALAASPAEIRLRTHEPDPSSNPPESERIKYEAKQLEREAVNWIPAWSAASIDFGQLKTLISERDKARAGSEGQP